MMFKMTRTTARSLDVNGKSGPENVKPLLISYRLAGVKLSTYRQNVSVKDKIFLVVTYCPVQELSREVEEGRRDAEERRSRSRGVVVEEDGVDHQVLDEVSGEMPARIADMEAEIRTLREANKSEQKT